jgi:hypothetical protein
MVPSSLPLTRISFPLRAEDTLLTNDVWPLNFFILVPVVTSHTPTVLSVAHEKILLKKKNDEFMIKDVQKVFRQLT